MEKEVEKKKWFIILFASMPFVWGGFYEFTAFIYGGICVMLLCKQILTDKQITIYTDYVNVSLAVFILGYWCSIFWAIDKGSALMGALKFTVPGIFFITFMQLEGNIRERCIQIVPRMGMLMVIISVICGIFESSGKYFWQAGRLGGFFQYSNTMALFLLIGLVIICFKETEKKKEMWFSIITLVVGILLTGSRTIFFLMVAFLIYMCVKTKKMRAGIMWMLGMIVATAFIYVGVTKDFQNIGRFFTTSIKSSTLLGRVLYNIDGLTIVKEHMGGIGYKGYSILQPFVQTGVYTAMFVHNDWLQIMLDAGVITGCALAFCVVYNLLSKQVCIRNKICIFIIAVHMLMDFDLQYLSIFCLLLLMFENGKGKKVYKCNKKYMLILSMLLVSIFYFYMFTAYFTYHIGEYEIANMMYGYDSQIKTTYMLNCQTIEEAECEADKIIQRNEYSYAAYNIKAVAAMEKQDYKNMIRYKKKGLEITKYEILEYEDYIVMLKKAIDNSSGGESEYYIQNLLQVENQIEDVLKNTNELAYMLRDKPELELREEFKEYIESYKK